MYYRYFPSKRYYDSDEDDKDKSSEVLSFIASTDRADRYGDVINQQGWDLDSYRANPVVLFGHDHNSLPIGRGAVRMAPEGLVIDIEFDKADPRAAEIAGKAERGFLNAVSVGFTPVKAVSRANLPVEHAAYSDQGGSYFEKAELLEVSIVTIPANADATAIAAKALDNKTKDYIRNQIESYMLALSSEQVKEYIKKQAVVEVQAPDGYHWMDYEDGPVLMEGDSADHDGGSEAFSFEVIEEHDPDKLRAKDDDEDSEEYKMSDKDDEEIEKADKEEEEDDEMSSKSFDPFEQIERHALIEALLTFSGE